MIEKLERLKVEIPHKWKVNNFNADKTKATCVGYIDARDVMDLLDSEIGAANWCDNYRMVGDKFMCAIGIKIDNEWVWKHDTGTASAFDSEKGQFSDAFKRAAVKWGVGRFLYDLDVKFVDSKPFKDSGYPIDNKGKRIWDLTKHFNSGVSKPKSNPLKPVETRVEPPKPRKAGVVQIGKFYTAGITLGYSELELRDLAVLRFKLNKFEDITGVQIKKATDGLNDKIKEQVDPVEIFDGELE